MFYGLEAGDGSAEGEPAHGIFLGHIETDLGAANLFPGKQHGCPVVDLLYKRPAFAFVAELFG